MSQPDQHGQQVVEVLDEDDLWRRIHPQHWVSDGRGGFRVSSAAFDDDGDGEAMSVDLAKMRTGVGETLDGHARFGLAAFMAGFARGLEQIVRHDPIAGCPTLPDNPAHTLVIGEKTRGVRRAFQREATVLVEPTLRNDGAV